MSTVARTTPAGGRLRSLDGLRGVAALIVVAWHSSLVLPQIANPHPQSVTGSALWWLENSPLKLATAGSQAVLIFFVLSGMVVLLPALRAPSYDWISYYPRRVIRLYLPVLGAVAFATICVLAHPQLAGNRVSSWIGLDSIPHPTISVFVQSADIFSTSNRVDNPLWSLRWEMIFSLALPLFLVGATLLKRRWKPAVAVAFVLVGVGYYTATQALIFLPVFFIGSLIAVNHDELAQWAARARGTRAGWAWFALLLGGFALLIANNLLDPIVGNTVGSVSRALSFLGAAIIVGVAFLWQPAVRALTIAPVRWLGRVSFSLYLVHVPIIYFFANLFGPGHWIAIVASSVVASLVIAELFTRFVEGPAHRLASWTGSAAAERFRRLRAPAPDADMTATDEKVSNSPEG